MQSSRANRGQRPDSGVIGHYRLLGSLGAGGMGRVSLARSPDGRLAAVKQIHPALAHDPGFRERFRHEVQASRRVSGAYTAPVLDADPDAPAPWLASLYIAGPTLQDAVKSAGPLPEDVVRRLAVGLVTALADIHRAGLIHRDLKPGNVLLAADGPRVIDFGIARASEGDSELTRSGAIIGSPAYMSPEQAQGERLTPASDVFSLGGLLVLAATGHAPFAGRSTPQTLYNVVHLDPDLSAVPPAIRYLAEPCLAKDPLRRPTPRHLLDALGALTPSPQPWPVAVHALITEREKAAAKALRGPVRRRNRITAAAVGAAVVVAGAVTIPVLLDRSTPEAAPAAATQSTQSTTEPSLPPAPLSPAGLRQIDPCKVLSGLQVTTRTGFFACGFTGAGQREISVGVPTGPIPLAEATETATVEGMAAVVRAETDKVRDSCRATVTLPDDPESALGVTVARDDQAGATAELCEDAKARLGEVVRNISDGSARRPDEDTTLGKLDPCALLTDDEVQPIFGVLPTKRPGTVHSCGWDAADSASLSLQLDYYDSPPFEDETRGERVTIGGLTVYQRPFTESEPSVCELRWLQHGAEGQAREVVSIRVRPPAEGNAVDTCRQARDVAAKVVPRLPR
ncbi:serine/threonine-protein kinase [Amycolatopsis sp. YIM 10]|uniref:serine/threonine-protein kinase n=1 Tax=Amycolatopsis sp. YIM 10 TaxID=2653857 RepID=UPI00128FDEA5|nr:serine/threonine-protein kinase [Amycolatopsis sp. YIM 10]QFU92556.1 Serine/threonine-protein kinase AfsK [Amycolatopsis sp. YIM 10]